MSGCRKWAEGNLHEGCEERKGYKEVRYLFVCGCAGVLSGWGGVPVCWRSALTLTLSRGERGSEGMVTAGVEV